MKCYKCGATLPPDANVCPACGQAIFTYFGSPSAAKGRRLDGWIASEPRPADFTAQPVLDSLPRRVDLRGGCSAVENQGQLGSCTANAAVGALEFLERKKGLPAVDLSRLFVYYNARRLSGRAGEDSGAQIPEVMASLLAYGAPPEEQWPYDPDNFAVEPPRGAYARAKDHDTAEYARVDGLEAIKGALAREHPVVFGATLPERCFAEAGRTGRMPAATATELDAAGGGHAMLAVGYDLDAGTILIRNSWGEEWGDRGYFWMPIELFAEAAVARRRGCTWILGALEAGGAFTVVRPGRSTKPIEGGVKDMAAKMRADIRGSLTKDLAESFKDIKNRIKPQG